MQWWMWCSRNVDKFEKVLLYYSVLAVEVTFCDLKMAPLTDNDKKKVAKFWAKNYVYSKNANIESWACRFISIITFGQRSSLSKKSIMVLDLCCLKQLVLIQSSWTFRKYLIFFRVKLRNESIVKDVKQNFFSNKRLISLVSCKHWYWRREDFKCFTGTFISDRWLKNCKSDTNSDCLKPLGSAQLSRYFLAGDVLIL